MRFQCSFQHSALKYEQKIMDCSASEESLKQKFKEQNKNNIWEKPLV